MQQVSTSGLKFGQKLPNNITTHAADGIDCSGYRHKWAETSRGYLLQRDTEQTGSWKAFRFTDKLIWESHSTTGVYVCSRKTGLDDLLLFSFFEYTDALNNCCYLEGRMFHICSWEAAEELITSFFTVLLISDTFIKYQDFLEVIFSLVLNVNSKIMGLGSREVGRKS